ncbi:MAG: hypothetical protein ABFD25_00595, partial [Clostridiaceae bacterium]
MPDIKRLSEYKGSGKNLLFSLPLYAKIKIELDLSIKHDGEVIDSGSEEECPYILEHTLFYENADFTYLKTLISAEMNIYNYCPFCKKDLILKSKPKEISDEIKNSLVSQDTNIDSEETYDACINYANKKFKERYNYLIENLLDSNRNFVVELECTSKKKHNIQIFFHLSEDNFLLKIGQYPAIIDFERDLSLYKGILKKNEIKELNRAFGLKSHGVGIGAFVYLRRIFENLVFKKAELALQNDSTLNRDELLCLPMDKKIKQLENYLPDFLVNNKFLYGIISKGIHELEEEDCLLYFDAVKDAILIILDEELESINKEKRKKEISKHLEAIHSKLK